MHIFRDTSSLRTAAETVPSLAQRLTSLVEAVSAETGGDPAKLLTIAVADRGDDLDNLSQALGIDLREEGAESLSELPGWFELTYIVNGEGFGYVVYVPKGSDLNASLQAWCLTRLPGKA